MKPIKPIKPSDVAKAKKAAIPPPVIGAFNECIADHWDGEASTFTQDEVIKKIITHMTIAEPSKMNGITRDDVFRLGYLDVESIYEAEGWKVTYDKPGYCESYAAKFTFEKP